mmetsp:Transcript_93353/g.302087  ORF Transcript_93353/g.302087 Transcript_93353/m.302087 type:complete len:381 (+) Transcript_93353:9324-10466(+)
MSRFMPQMPSTRHTGSALSFASVNNLPIFARCFRTMAKSSGLSWGSKQALISWTVPSSVGSHLVSESWLPNSRISASFNDAAHSKNASMKLAFCDSGKSCATFSTTSDNTLPGWIAPKTARRCSTFSAKPCPAVPTVSAVACSTKIPISDSTFFPGFSSCNVGTDSMASAGATAHTNLCSEGRKTDFKAKNCAAPFSGFLEGFVAGTQAKVCNFSSAAARAPDNLEWFLSKYPISTPARGKSLSLTTASASSTASSHVSSAFKPHRRRTRQIASLLRSEFASMSLTCARYALTMLNCSGLVSGSKQARIAFGFPSFTGNHSKLASWLPSSLISTSFHEPAHSRKERSNVVSFEPISEAAAGRTTSFKIRAVARAPKHILK